MNVTQEPNHSQQWLIVPILEKLQKPALRQVFLTKSYCFILSCSCVDFKHMKLTLLLFGGMRYCPKLERSSALPFNVAGRVQSCSVQVWFPLKACHSPHVIDSTEKRGKPVHLGSIYLHYSARGPSLSPLPSHTYPNKHCHDCMQMDNMSS